MELKTFVGDRLRTLRKLSGMTTNELAEKIGSSSGYISDIEGGRTLPSLQKLNQICSALSISLADFFATAQNVKPLHPRLRELAEAAGQLNPDMLSLARRLLDDLIEWQNEASRPKVNFRIDNAEVD